MRKLEEEVNYNEIENNCHKIVNIVLNSNNETISRTQRELGLSENFFQTYGYRFLDADLATQAIRKSKQNNKRRKK